MVKRVVTLGGGKKRKASVYIYPLEENYRSSDMPLEDKRKIGKGLDK